jgi:hypothetical protein
LRTSILVSKTKRINLTPGDLAHGSDVSTDHETQLVFVKVSPKVMYQVHLQRLLLVPKGGVVAYAQHSFINFIRTGNLCPAKVHAEVQRDVIEAGWMQVR